MKLKSDMHKDGQYQGRSRTETDTEGYRDYRGVQVFGAWLWNADLGLGLATEIDTDDGPVRSYAQVAAADVDRFRKFFHGMLERGIALAPGAYEAIFPSLAHGDADVPQPEVEGENVAAGHARSSPLRRARPGRIPGGNLCRAPRRLC